MESQPQTSSKAWIQARQVLWVEHAPLKLIPNAPVLRGGACKRWLAHEDSTLMNGLILSS
jgi:hypothetical protein